MTFMAGLEGDLELGVTKVLQFSLSPMVVDENITMHFHNCPETCGPLHSLCKDLSGVVSAQITVMSRSEFNLRPALPLALMAGVGKVHAATANGF